MLKKSRRKPTALRPNRGKPQRKRAERWVRAFSFPDYEVSTLGGLRRVRDGRVLNPYLHKSGYRQTRLVRSGKSITVRMNRIVYQSFKGPVDRKIDVHHKNDDKSDDRLRNLKPLTRRQHAAVSPHRVGVEHHKAKLNPVQISEIRTLHANGIGYRKLSKKFLVRRNQIMRIVKRINWKSVA